RARARGNPRAGARTRAQRRLIPRSGAAQGRVPAPDRWPVGPHREEAAMNDAKVLLDPGTRAEERLARRGYRLDTAALRELVRRRNETTDQANKLRAESNRLAKEGRGASPEAAALRERARELKDQIQ